MHSLLFSHYTPAFSILRTSQPRTGGHLHVCYAFRSHFFIPLLSPSQQQGRQARKDSVGLKFQAPCKHISRHHFPNCKKLIFFYLWPVLLVKSLRCMLASEYFPDLQKILSRIICWAVWSILCICWFSNSPPPKKIETSPANYTGSPNIWSLWGCLILRP